MILKALRRARLRHRILFVALLLFVAGLFGAVGVTSAFFQAELDTKTNTFAGGYLAVPTIAGVAASGYDGVLTWTNGTDQTTTDNEVQQIFGADQGTTSNCTGAVYSTTVLNSTTSPTTTQAFTYSDSNRATSPSNINGDWYCYEVVHGWPNTTAPVWTSAATTNVQVGLAPVSVVANGNGDGKFGSGDSITITFNQPVATGIAGSASACQFHTTGTGADFTYLGDSTCSTSGDSYTLGKITGITNGGATNSHASCTGSIAVSGAQVTYTASCSVNGSHGVTMSGLGTWLSSSTVKSSAVTDQASACTTANANCQKTPTGTAW